MYVVYKHTTPSGKVYIGITKRKPEQRWESGNGYKDNEHFYRAILKYGWENIKHEIVCTGLSKWQAGKVEQSLIDYFDSTNPDKGYNHSTGGEYGGAGVQQSAETRRKHSEALKGRHVSDELRRKNSESHKGQIPWNKGKHLSHETRRKISESKKGARPSLETRRKLSEALKCSNNPFYGKHLSVETRKKISEALKGRTAWNRGKKGQISQNRKAVVCVETGTLYSSTTEAAESIGLTRKAVSNVVRGINKTAGGYHWKYAGGDNEKQISC